MQACGSPSFIQPSIKSRQSCGPQKTRTVDIGFTRGCVYEIPCRDCDVCYVGETKRMLATRCKEHRASCKKIQEGQQLKDSERYDTGLPNHVLETNHEFNFENVKVLRKENNQKRRKFLEAIEILKNGNTANLYSGQQLDQNWLPIIERFLRRKSSIMMVLFHVCTCTWRYCIILFVHLTSAFAQFFICPGFALALR